MIRREDPNHVIFPTWCKKNYDMLSFNFVAIYPTNCDYRKTRTCIHTPGYPPMRPDELPQSSIISILSGARIVYFDGRLHETALLVAQEVILSSSS